MCENESRVTSNSGGVSNLCDTVASWTSFTRSARISKVVPSSLLIAPFFIYRLTRFTECFILPMIKFSSSEDSVSVVSKSGITMFVRISPKCCIFECFSSLSPSCFLRLSQAYRGLFLWKRRVKICFWPNNLWTKFSSAKFQLRPLTTGTYMSRETCQDCSWPPHWFALSLHHITKRHRHPKWFYDFERMQFGLPHCALKSKTCFRYSSSTPIRLQAKKAGYVVTL